ncbi:glycine receptor subunit alpha-2-like [Clytia hemisphaerica]
MSKLFEEMFQDYDMNVLPSVSGEALNISTGMYINDMVPINPINMHYSMDIYFRQYWRDHRLAYDHLLPDYIHKRFENQSYIKSFAFESNFVNRVWKPDLFFSLVKTGENAKITKPNQLIRLSANGDIFYSQRLTMTVFCEMDLYAFPFDKQTCPFYIESYAYSASQISLNWVEGGKPIIPPKFKDMLEFTFDDHTYDHEVVDYGLGDMFHRLHINFKFSRNIQYYILQIYVPALLIVILSWVGFWIDYRSTPARVALGITTVLTMITFSKSVRNLLPFVNYSKLIDWYLLVCFFYVFMGLVEYAAVGVIDQKWKRKLEGLTNSIFGTTSNQTNGNNSQVATPNTFEFTQFHRSISENSFLSIKKEDVGLAPGNGLAGPVNGGVADTSLQQPIDDSFGVGYLSRSPRGGGEHGEVLSKGSNDVTPTIFEETGNHAENGRGIRNEAFDVNSSPSPSIPSNESFNGGFKLDFGASINSTNTLTDRRKKNRLNKFKSTRQQMSARLLERQKKDLEVHIIDKISRYVYPISFLIYNVIYFTYAFAEWSG